MKKGINCRIGNNVVFAPDTILGDNNFIGNNVTFYPNVIIGSDCTIMDNSVLGRLPLRTRIQNLDVTTEYIPLTIGDGCVVGCSCIIYTGVTLKENVAIHDLCVIRERSLLANDVVLARNVLLQPDTLIGERTRIMDFVELPGPLLIEEDVFISPGVMMANDKNGYLTRFHLHEPHTLKGPTIRRYAMLGPNATLLPGVEIGQGAQVAAGAVVTKDVSDWTVVAGVPARYLRDIPDEWRAKILEKEKNGHDDNV
jgi:acetyltransferase-like isoleucine patch superfamily enzyme